MSGEKTSSNVSLGLFLGVAAAGVILALSGCAAGTGATGAQASHPKSNAAAGPELTQFSQDEQSRILAVQHIVARAANEHELDPSLLNGIIWVESRFNPKAKSPAGARGLMQLMPSTAAYLAKRLGVNSARAYDPDFNVRAGALYLAEMIERFGDEAHAIAAYHAGPGNVKKWLANGDPFPDYSDNYVAKVMEARERFRSAPTHGGRSSDRAVVAAPMAKPGPHEEDEPMVVPDVDSLPDAAEIHGMPRVIHESPAPRPRPQPQPEPEVYETVFEPHPEMDNAPAAAPRGWRMPRQAPERRAPAPKAEPKPKPTPKPKPEPKPKPKPNEPVGVGVLPDL